jgi:hypothetical protein
MNTHNSTIILIINTSKIKIKFRLEKLLKYPWSGQNYRSAPVKTKITKMPLIVKYFF